jgi:hypothetical protein
MAYFKRERNKALQLSMEKRALIAMNGAMEEIVRQGVSEGIFDTDHPRQTAIAILSMAHGLSNDLPETRTREEIQEHFQVLKTLTERVLGMKPGSFVFSDRLLPPEFCKN